MPGLPQLAQQCPKLWRTFLLPIICIGGSLDYGRRLPNGSVLLDAISSALSSPRSDDAISEELFDLIGYDHIELVMEILQNRAGVVQEVRPSSTQASRCSSPPRFKLTTRREFFP